MTSTNSSPIYGGWDSPTKNSESSRELVDSPFTTMSTNSSPIPGGWHSPKENIDSPDELVNFRATVTVSSSSPILDCWPSLKDNDDPSHKVTHSHATAENTHSSLVLFGGWHSPIGNTEDPCALGEINDMTYSMSNAFTEFPEDQSVESLASKSLDSPMKLLKLPEMISTPTPSEGGRLTSTIGATPHNGWLDLMEHHPSPPSVTRMFSPIPPPAAGHVESYMMNLVNKKHDPNHIHGDEETTIQQTNFDVRSVKGSKNSPGNRHFGRLVSLHAPSYARATTNDEKRAITKSIYEAISRNGGRFIKVFRGKLVQMSDRAVHTKVSRALKVAVTKLNKMKQVSHDNASASPMTSAFTSVSASAHASDKPHAGLYKGVAAPVQQPIAPAVSMSPGQSGGSKPGVEKFPTLDLDAANVPIAPMEGVHVHFTKTCTHMLGMTTEEKGDPTYIADYEDSETAIMAGNFIMNRLIEGLSFQGAVLSSFDLFKPNTTFWENL